MNHSRPFRSFPEIYAFSGKTCLLFRQPEKSSSIQDIFSACPKHFSPSLSPQINDILLKPSPFKSIQYFPCLLRQRLLGKTPKRLSISAVIPTASSFHTASSPEYGTAPQLEQRFWIRRHLLSHLCHSQGSSSFQRPKESIQSFSVPIQKTDL